MASKTHITKIDLLNKLIKQILVIIGIILLVYGIYMFIVPEASLIICSLEIQSQDNTNAYITIGLGIASLLVSLMAEKKV